MYFHQQLLNLMILNILVVVNHLLIVQVSLDLDQHA